MAARREVVGTPGLIPSSTPEPEPRRIQFPQVAPRVPGVWVKFHYDGSGNTPYAEEIDALRAAVGTGAEVVFVPFGTEIMQAVRLRDDEERRG